MRPITQTELEKIIQNHLHYLNKDCEGWEKLKFDLHGADLSGADLRYANLRYANLRDMKLRYADLSGADLGYADLSNTDLSNANLTYAILNCVNLYGADLCYANLYGADLSYTQGEYRKGKTLTDDIIGYKKCRNGIIVTLLIPRGAIVFSINGKKCRTNKAKVINIGGADRAYSTHKYMSYYVGDEFNIYDFDCQYNVECSTGIHFFIDKRDAMNY